MGLTRREWLRRASRATVGLAVGGSMVTAAGCGEQLLAPLEDPESGHLVVRTGEPLFAPTLGVHELGLGTTRDGVRFVPSTYRADEALPLVLTLHGYGSDGYAGLRSYLTWAETNRVVLLSPDSRGATWERAFGAFGVDSRFIDNALSETFLRCRIDPRRIAIAGFSDGASYALSLGRTNGDLFSQMLAFAPGYMAPNGNRGKPSAFVAHGTRDPVLSFERTRDTFVPRLRTLGYAVTFRDFDGTHTVPSAIGDEGRAWLLSQWAV